MTQIQTLRPHHQKNIKNKKVIEMDKNKIKAQIKEEIKAQIKEELVNKTQAKLNVFDWFRRGKNPSEIEDRERQKEVLIADQVRTRLSDYLRYLDACVKNASDANRKLHSSYASFNALGRFDSETKRILSDKNVSALDLSELLEGATRHYALSHESYVSLVDYLETYVTELTGVQRYLRNDILPNLSEMIDRFKAGEIDKIEIEFEFEFSDDEEGGSEDDEEESTGNSAIDGEQSNEVEAGVDIESIEQELPTIYSSLFD